MCEVKSKHLHAPFSNNCADESSTAFIFSVHLVAVELMLHSVVLSDNGRLELSKLGGNVTSRHHLLGEFGALSLAYQALLVQGGCIQALIYRQARTMW